MKPGIFRTDTPSLKHACLHRYDGLMMDNIFVYAILAATVNTNHAGVKMKPGIFPMDTPSLKHACLHRNDVLMMHNWNPSNVPENKSQEVISCIQR